MMTAIFTLSDRCVRLNCAPHDHSVAHKCKLRRKSEFTGTGWDSLTACKVERWCECYWYGTQIVWACLIPLRELWSTIPFSLDVCHEFRVEWRRWIGHVKHCAQVHQVRERDSKVYLLRKGDLNVHCGKTRIISVGTGSVHPRLRFIIRRVRSAEKFQVALQDVQKASDLYYEVFPLTVNLCASSWSRI